jgi:hypothetical protein
MKLMHKITFYVQACFLVVVVVVVVGCQLGLRVVFLSGKYGIEF